METRKREKGTVHYGVQSLGKNEKELLFDKLFGRQVAILIAIKDDKGRKLIDQKEDFLRKASKTWGEFSVADKERIVSVDNEKMTVAVLKAMKKEFCSNGVFPIRQNRRIAAIFNRLIAGKEGRVGTP